MADAGEAHRMTMNNVEERVRQLTMLRNVGEKTALGLLDLGIETPEQMFEADPETLFEELKHRRGASSTAVSSTCSVARSTALPGRSARTRSRHPADRFE